MTLCNSYKNLFKNKNLINILKINFLKMLRNHTTGFACSFPLPEGIAFSVSFDIALCFSLAFAHKKYVEYIYKYIFKMIRKCMRI